MKTKAFTITFSIIVFITIYFKMFNYDFGFTGDYFIERSFNEAFDYFKKGECEDFNSCLANGSDMRFCENGRELRVNKNYTITQFEYLYAIRHGNDSAKVFLIVHGLNKGIVKDEVAISYEMIKEDFEWKLKIPTNN